MRLTEHDYGLIRAAVARNFSQDAIKSLMKRTINADFRTQLARIDMEFFFRFYLGEYFSDPMSDVHRASFEDIRELRETRGRAQLVEVWPRGFGKSTILCEGLPLWIVCNGLGHFIPIISDSLDQAIGHLDVIKRELENNERLREDYGDFVSRKTWRQESIVTNSGVTITALGSGTRIRGRKKGSKRPDWIILDDIENNRAVRSETQRKTLRDWLTQEVIPAGSPNCKVIMVGNFIHYACLLKECYENPMWRGRLYQAINSFSDNPGLWAEWEDIITDISDKNHAENAQRFYLENKKDMLQGTKVEWPDRQGYSYLELMKQLVTIGRAQFFTEYQNEPNDPAQRFFNYKTYTKRMGFNENGQADVFLVPWDEYANDGNGGPSGDAEVPLSMCTLYAATDPAMGATVKSDFAAILIGAKSPDGRGFVLEADIKKRTPEQIIQAQNRWLEIYPQIVRWIIESNQFQAFFASEAARSSMEQGTYGRYVPIDSTGSKEMRIESIQPDLWNGYTLICQHGQHELRKQLDEYPNGAKDDGPDALEMLIRAMRSDDSPESTAITMATNHTFFEHQSKNVSPFAIYEQLADEEDELRKEGVEGSPIYF